MWVSVISVPYEHFNKILCNPFFIGLGIGQCSVESESSISVILSTQHIIRINTTMECDSRYTRNSFHQSAILRSFYPPLIAEY